MRFPILTLFLLMVLVVCICLICSGPALAAAQPAPAPAVAQQAPVLPQAPPLKGVCACCLGGVCTCGDRCECGAEVKAPAKKAWTYGEALDLARQQRKPLVVGVRCEAPAGDWIACRVEQFPGVQGKAVILSVPNAHTATGMEWLNTFDPGATAADVRDLLAPARATAPAFSPAFGAPAFGAPAFGAPGGGRACST